MKGAPDHPVKPLLRRISLPAWLSILIAASLGAAAGGYYLYFTGQIGQAQPIPFSHRFHVTEKKLSCVLCHPGALNSERAGVPPLETCMLCHRKIIVRYPPIVTLRQHYDERKPVEWVHLNVMRQFVYFDHGVHVQAGFDCGKCHGDVGGMDRVYPVQDLNAMGFCVQCHRDEGFSHDCLICHR
jgi:hypothetical protein